MGDDRLQFGKTPEQERELAEKDVNAAIKLILSEIEVAARTLPVQACHPYEAERRRKVIIRAVWTVYRRGRPEREE